MGHLCCLVESNVSQTRRWANAPCCRPPQNSVGAKLKDPRPAVPLVSGGSLALNWATALGVSVLVGKRQELDGLKSFQCDHPSRGFSSFIFIPVTARVGGQDREQSRSSCWWGALSIDELAELARHCFLW